MKSLHGAILPGLFTGFLVVILSVSFSLLIFRGPLAPFLEKGIAMSIITAVVTGLAWTLFGQIRPTVAMADEDTAPVIALLGAFIVAATPEHWSAEQMFASVASAIVLSTLFSGLGLVLFGSLRLGTSIQYLPHSVMGGYFAAIGWLLLAGGFGTTTPGTAYDYTEFSSLLNTSAAWSWGPALLVTATLLLLKKRIPKTWLFPGVVLLFSTAWYMASFAAGHSVEELMASGLLIGPFTETRLDLANPLFSMAQGDVNWSAVFANPGSMLTVFLMSVLSLMFCIHGLGLFNSTDPDMNRELKLAGVANVFNGLGGGVIGLPSYGMSTLSSDLGADQSVWPGLLTVAVVGAVALFGLELVEHTPRFVLGGLLMVLGIQLLDEWILKARHRFSLLEYALIPAILLVSVGIGFLEGVLVGLVAAVLLFVVKYSRTDVIRFTAPGNEINSNVDRNMTSGQILESQGDCALVIGLQGFLFFGTAGRVYQSLKQSQSERLGRPLKYLVIDFGQVSGIDASASLNFCKIEHMAVKASFDIVFAGIDEALLDRLRLDGFGTQSPETLWVFPDLDRALEWTENKILADAGQQGGFNSCFEQLFPFLESRERLEIFQRFLEERKVTAGQVLTSEGDDSTELFFIETATASAYITQPDGVQIRVRTTEQGTVYGELGFYLSSPRTASVQTDSEGRVFVLSQTALKRLETEHSEIAAGLHRFMARLLSERLLNTTQTLKALLL
ncbi:MAG: SulP family inorganic anion transporter [Halioglobus sp.]